MDQKQRNDTKNGIIALLMVGLIFKSTLKMIEGLTDEERETVQTKILELMKILKK